MSCSSCGRASSPGDRFCAGCGASLEVRCATCSVVLPGDARFCPSCGAQVGGTSSSEVHDGSEERKVVSVLFADVVGFTASSDGADPEDMRRRIQPFHTALREAVEGFGGRIEKLMGDGVLAVFGVPTVHEDDAERAVRSGIRAQERIAEIGAASGLRARIAIGTGEAIVRLGGATTDREGILGDVVNTTSRLQAEAEPGTVLVDSATHRATRRAFTYEERPPVAVKGKSEPLAVWVPIAPIARLGSDLDDDVARFVGRSSELSLLTDAFQRTIEDRTTQVVTITGEPGVGKSRLVTELRRHIEDLPDLIRWRQGRCPPYGEGIAYWALGEIVKAEAGVLETDTPATAAGRLAASVEPLIDDPAERSWVTGRLAPLVGTEVVASTGKEERFNAWYRYLSAMADQRPTVVVIEDLHWADDNLVEFLGDVPDAARGTPLLLVCTARPDFFEGHPDWSGGQRNSLTVGLEPLSAEATIELLDELLAGEDLSADMRAMVVDRSGGNPLWAQEFVRMLHDRAADSPALAVPDTVQSVVAARIDLLDAETKLVLQAASTIGKSFWTGAVQALLDDADDAAGPLRELVRRELVRRERVSTVSGETEFAFTHSVVRDVAYGQAPRGVRAARHARAARWVEAMAGDRIGDRAEVIAHHDAEALRLATASNIPDVTPFVDAAVASHVRAAERTESIDTSISRGHFEAAAQLVADGDPRRASIIHGLARATFQDGGTDAAIKLLLEAVPGFDELGDVEGWGQAMADLARFRWVTGQGDEQTLGEAIERLERHPPGPALARVYAEEAGRRWISGSAPAETIAFIERVRPIVEVHGVAADRGRLISAEGGARFDMGDPGAVDAFRQALRMALEADYSYGITTAYLNLGEQLRTGWSVHEAAAVHERGLEVAVQRHIMGTEAFLRESIASDFVWMGRWGEAREHLDVVAAHASTYSYLERGVEALGLMLDACQGDAPDDAVVRLEGAVEYALGLQDLQLIVPTYERMAWVLLVGGDEERATGIARSIVEISGASRYLIDAWSIVVWLLHRAGELGVVTAILGDLRAFDMPRPRALIEVVDALTAGSGPGEAVDRLEAAAATLADLGFALDAAVTLSTAAELARSAGREDRASAIGGRARAILEGTSAVALFERLGI